MKDAFNNLQSFDFYIKNSSQLNTDLKRVELVNQNLHSTISEKLVIDLRNLNRDLPILSVPQSITLLTNRVADEGWINLERMTKEIGTMCEGHDFSSINCLKKIEKTQDFVENSNLSEDHKIEVNRELDFYKIQQTILAKYHKEFKSDFNKNISAFNQLNTTTKTENKLIVSKLEAAQVSIPYLNELKLYLPGLAGLLLIALLVSAFAKKSKRSKLVAAFYGSFFRIQKISGLNVRLFGKLSLDSIKRLSKPSAMFVEMFSKKRTFFGEVQFRFLENENVLKLEAKYLSKDSLQLLYEETTGEVSTIMKKLVSEIEEIGGEVIFSTRIDHYGQIQFSSLSIYLPR